MVRHMLWILTSEEFDKLALDGIAIPHEQWTLTLILSHGLIEQFSEPQLGVVCYRSKKIVPYYS